MDNIFLLLDDSKKKKNDSGYFLKKNYSEKVMRYVFNTMLSLRFLIVKLLICLLIKVLFLIKISHNDIFLH
jgi:hypothetical protein